MNAFFLRNDLAPDIREIDVAARLPRAAEHHARQGRVPEDRESRAAAGGRRQRPLRAPSPSCCPSNVTDTQPRRFLFVMQYPGYLRYLDSTVRGLAARGHHVDVVFDIPHKQAEGAEALAGVPGVEVLDGRTPRGGDRVWDIVARAVRGTIDYVRYYHPKFADAHATCGTGCARSCRRRSASSRGATRPPLASTRALVSLFTRLRARHPEQPEHRALHHVARAGRRARHAAGHRAVPPGGRE